MLSFLIAQCPAISAQQTPQLPDILLPEEPERPAPVQPLPKPEIELEPPPDVPEVDFQSTIDIGRFQFAGNTVISDQELSEITDAYVGRKLDVKKLLEIRALVTQQYESKGYTTSKAFILVADNLSFDSEQADITIRVIEGKLQDIDIQSAKGLKKYIKRRINATDSGVFNQNMLFDSLRQLQLDDRIDRVSASLSPSSRADESILTLTVDLSKISTFGIDLNNYGSPSVGTFTRGISYGNLNLSGLGDTLTIRYSNTLGSNGVSAAYGLPLTADDLYAEFSYSYVASNIVEPPFDELDISASSQSFRLSLQQPVYRKTTDSYAQSLTLGLSASREESEAFLFNQPFPVFGGADDNGRIRTTVVSFFQDFNRVDAKQSLALKSIFNFGLDVATDNDQSEFFSWQGQALWVRRLPLNLQLFTRADLQFSDRSLLSSQQAPLGGISTVRGFRVNQLTTDNAAIASAELRIPAYSGSAGQLVVFPFIDFGVGYNNTDDPFETTGVLASTGIGLQYVYKNISLRLDYGYGFVGRSTRRRTLHENGLTASFNVAF